MLGDPLQAHGSFGAQTLRYFELFRVSFECFGYSQAAHDREWNVVHNARSRLVFVVARSYIVFP